MGGECECDAEIKGHTVANQEHVWVFLANCPGGFRPCVKVRPHTRNVEVLLERAAIG